MPRWGQGDVHLSYPWLAVSPGLQPKPPVLIAQMTILQQQHSVGNLAQAMASADFALSGTSVGLMLTPV